MTAPQEGDGMREGVSSAELLVLRAAALLDGIDGPDALVVREPAEELQQRLRGAEGHVWQRLVELFALSPAEADLLALAIAVAAEPALGPAIGRAQGQPRRLLPTESLIKRMHGHHARPIWRPTSPLAVWQLVQPTREQHGEALAFEADPRLVDWLFGVLSLDAELVPVLRSLPSESVPAEWPVEVTAARLKRALGAGHSIRLAIEGRQGSGRARFAAAVAKALGRTSLMVEPEHIEDANWASVFMKAQRFALAADAALVWSPCDRRWPLSIPLAPLQFVCVDLDRPAPHCSRCADLRVLVPEASASAKRQLWSDMAPHLSAASDAVAASPGTVLADLVETAQTLPATAEEALAQLRARGRTRLASAGDVLDPDAKWDDLVLPPHTLAQLQRIAFEARIRPTLAESDATRRLFRGEVGLAVLFSGPPGVGKSLAAQVLAKDLGINLLRIDLAATNSKWIGETAKNLSAAFEAATRAGAALLFEEADALFAKRSEVRESTDRYANADTNHLLHLIEVSGVRAFLTTNRRANMDPAFLRRLDHIVEFERPGPAERRTLWFAMLKSLGVSTRDLDGCLERLGESHNLSPAQIKAAALGAWMSARQKNRDLRPSDLDAAAAHELTKEGRTPPAGEPMRRSNGVTRG